MNIKEKILRSFEEETSAFENLCGLSSCFFSLAMATECLQFLSNALKEDENKDL